MRAVGIDLSKRIRFRPLNNKSQSRLTQPSIYRQLFVDEKRTIRLAYDRQMSIVR
jgi:hypothetical protein